MRMTTKRQMEMNTLEIIAICEAVAAIVMILVVIAVAAALKMRRKGKDRLYDPYGLYAPITAEQLAELDRAAALVAAEAEQLRQNAESVQSEESL